MTVSFGRLRSWQFGLTWQKALSWKLLLPAVDAAQQMILLAWTTSQVSFPACWLSRIWSLPPKLPDTFLVARRTKLSSCWRLSAVRDCALFPCSCPSAYCSACTTTIVKGLHEMQTLQLTVSRLIRNLSKASYRARDIFNLTRSSKVPRPNRR